MNRYLKIILGIFILILLLLVLSPFISLILPEKLTNHTYYRLLYHVIVDRKTVDCQNNEEKALHLFQYVVNHEFIQGTPYKCKPAESLIYGQAYCDFQARTLNALLGIAGVESRYAMLLDRKNKDISPHTLNEIFLNEKWCVFDTSFNIVFKNRKGDNLSLDDMSGDFSLISNEEKFIASKDYNKETYEYFISCFGRVFPMPTEPKRSIPRMYQTHIFDDILDIYFKIFKYDFFNLYQDIYLKFKKNYSGQNDFRLFFIARNYQLAYRDNLALKYYNILLKDYPQSKYTEDAIFFSGILCFDMKNYIKAIESFKVIVDKYSKWKNASFYYLGKTYNLVGNREAALKAYFNVSPLLLSADILEELNKYKSEQNIF